MQAHLYSGKPVLERGGGFAEMLQAMLRRSQAEMAKAPVQSLNPSSNG
jgi:hypothetical protein